MSMDVRDLVREFDGLDGRPEDGHWAARVLMKLTWAGLDAHVTQRLLEQALDEVREAGEPARDVLGDPDEWAQDQLLQSSQEGATFLDDAFDANSAAVIALG